MVRSLYSGVAGMVTHQSKMDVIGNNISNVSTYGYKSSRATFRDVYYQTSSSASAATATSGGTNPTQIGYGAKLGSVDVNHSQSVMSTTGYTLDVAIAGEGYLQVMDADGNIFYTKAGMLDIDATIFCEKETHKRIIIGKNGSMLKKISTFARQDIERFFDCRVFLQTWVKVKEDWRNHAQILQNFGYDEKNFD